VFEISLTAQREVAEPVEIGLQAGHRILGVSLLGASGRGERRRRLQRRWLPRFFVLFGNWNFLHVLRMAINVMSSFWGAEPVKSRTSWLIFFTIACAPSFALARTDSVMRSRPNSSPSVFSVSVTPSVYRTKQS